MGTKKAMMKNTTVTENDLADLPDEVDEDSLAELLGSLPEDVMLELCIGFGLTEEGGRDG